MARKNPRGASDPFKVFNRSQTSGKVSGAYLEKLIDAHHRLAMAHASLAQTGAILTEAADAEGGPMPKKHLKGRR